MRREHVIVFLLMAIHFLPQWLYKTEKLLTLPDSLKMKNTIGVLSLKMRSTIRLSMLLISLCIAPIVAIEAHSAQLSPQAEKVQKSKDNLPDKRKSIEIYLEKSSGSHALFYLPETANLMQFQLQDQGCDVLSYDRSEMVKAIRNNPPDFVIVNSDLASVLQRYRHYDHLMSFKNRVSSDAGKLSGSLFVVRKDSEYKEVGELSGKKIGRLSSSTMAGWKTAVGEVTLLGYSAADFFRRIQSYPSDEKMIDALVKGDISAAILQGCHFERLPESLRKEVQPLEPRSYQGTHCLATSELYPAWSILAAPTVPEQLKRRITEALENERTILDFGEWTEPAPLRDVYAMLKRSDDELIGEFEPESWSSILWKARYPALVVLLVLLALLIHDRLVVRAVNRQTELVKESLSKQWEIERKIEAWERASVISIMSSMVAHEVKQPLSVIENYTQSLLSRQNRSGEPIPVDTQKFVLGKIEQSVRKAIEIIEHVQSYSKNRPPELKPTDVSQLLRKITTDFQVKNPEVKVETSIRSNLIIAGDEFELSVCFVNILKNAAQAMASEQKPQITVSADLDEDGSVKAVFTDNGCGLTNHEIENLRHPLQTSKEEGLGLGLSIVKAIAERHRGSIRMEPAQPRGLSVIVLLGKPLEAAS